MNRIACIALVAFAACGGSRADAPIDPPPVEAAIAPPRIARIDAKELLAKFECNRCHEVPDTAPAPRDKHCFACHQQIHDGTFDAKAESLTRWQNRIQSLRYAPSLSTADRLRRDWVKAFLLHPHDLRPGSVAEMPRLAISDAEATRLALFLVPVDETRPTNATLATANASPDLAALATPKAARDAAALATPNGAPDTAQLARGEQLFRTYACGRCHRFTGASVDDVALHELGRRIGTPIGAPSNTDVLGARVAVTSATHAGSSASPGSPLPAWVLAPDLQFARDRVQPTQLARWIAAPRGAMPKLAVSDVDARALATFIASTPLAQPARTTSLVPTVQPRIASSLAPPAATVPQPAVSVALVVARLPVLTREVTWAEVSKKVFHDQCWHCHAVPDFARGDGGPGNSGGFGFRPRGLDVSSYTGISQGSLDDGGERHSIFEQLPDGTPRVVAHLMARHAEEVGGEVVGIRGMPLGLPALSLEQIQLVESWIAQGRPQ